MPNCTATGKNMGVKIKTAGVISIKVPTSKSTRLISRRMTILLSDTAISAVLIFWGMFSKDMIQDMPIDAPTSSITMAVMEDVSSRI